MCMPMNPSFDEQRRSGQKGRNESLHPTSWVGRHLTRRISPYVTWAFLRLGITANQCTVLRLVLTLGIAVMFATPVVWWWIGGVFARYGTVVLDCVDGELARIRGTSSPEGTYLDQFACEIGWVAVIAGMTCGLYRGLGGLHVVIIGLAATVGVTLTTAHLPLVRSVAFEWGVKASAGDAKRNRLPGPVAVLRRAAKFFLVMPGVQYLPHVLAASVLDALLAPFMIGGLAFDVRLLWMAFFGAGTLLAVVVRGILTVRLGLRTQL